MCKLLSISFLRSLCNRASVVFSVFFCAAAAQSVCSAQGTFHVTFDGSPTVPRGSAVVVQAYYEWGFSFTGLPGSDGFTRQGGGATLSPDNGTAYIQAGSGDSLVFSNANGNAFSLAALDLAGFSTVAPNFSVLFMGYRSDGSTVSTNFSGSGINFRTVFFGPEFSGLARVEIPTYAWSLDNLVVTVPEPSIASLAMLVAIGLLLLRGKYRSARFAAVLLVVGLQAAGPVQAQEYVTEPTRDLDGNRLVDKNDTSARDANQIFEARAKLTDIKQFLNQWAVSHPTSDDDPFMFDRVSSLVGLCQFDS
jgi:hypothetical protein